MNMQHIFYIILVVVFMLPSEAKAQNYDRLWATGTAVPQGTVELAKRPDGLFRFAGALNAGELKIMTTETFEKGITMFLKPQLVDSYLINNGLRYTLTSDETQPGWVVSFQENTYRFLVDPVNRKVTGELMLPWNEVLIAGSAFVGGSNNVEWNRNAMLSFERDHDNPYLFSWTGELGIFDNVIEPGRFKLEGQMTWGPRELHPYVQDEDILEAQYMRQGGDDTKWRVSKAGTYRIVVDLFYETIHAELVRKANTLSPTNIETVILEKEQQVEYYDMNGFKMQQLRRGINIVRLSDGTIHKVMVK
jgi:hypothetical protein